MKKDSLRPFIALGIDFKRRSGDQAIAECPFTGKEGKFYVNKTNGLWDSKTAGLSGNVIDFLEAMLELFQELRTPDRIELLARNRKLPAEAFASWNIGVRGAEFILPLYNLQGRVCDLRHYRVGQHPRSTAGCSPGLFGLDKFDKDQSVPVYLCEGEWDAIAMRWALLQTGQRGTVLGVPGAGMFRSEWATILAGRDVLVCYDNDAAGEQGELRLERILSTSARSVRYLHWPPKTRAGFDIRDLVVLALTEQNLESTMRWLSKRFQPRPRLASVEIENAASGAGIYQVPADFDKFVQVFSRWLLISNPDALAVVLAVLISNRYDGDPLWLFLVAPPGGSKTETLTALSRCEAVTMVSSLTPRALISGMNTGANDPSLIPKLNGRVLVVKDFTSILSLKDSDRDEIFGTLRDAFDGRCVKTFGNGITRDYRSRFSVLAAVTPSIYSINEGGLGERFLKYAISPNLEREEDAETIRRAIANNNVETQMRADLQEVAISFMNREWPNTLPPLEYTIQERIVALAQYTAMLRGTVMRNRYREDMIEGRASFEVGTRLGKQFTKLGQCLALVFGNTGIGEREYRILRKSAVDTTSQRGDDIVHTLYQENQWMLMHEIAMKSGYPQTTVRRVLNDMRMLGIAKTLGTPFRSKWRLTDKICRLIEQAQLHGAGR